MTQRAWLPGLIVVGLLIGLAGMARIPYPRFLAFNAAGGAIWASAFVLLGYAVGSQYKAVEHNASLVGYGIIGLVLLYAGYRYLKHRKAERAERQQRRTEENAGV